MIEISASVLTVEKENAIKTFYNLETAKIDYFHIDVMDGKFVEKNNIELMKDYALTISHITNIGLDVHLMVEDVEAFVDEYLMFSPKMLSFHIEAMKGDKQKTFDLIKKIKETGTKVGLAISPNTKISEIEEYLDYLHYVLVMTVEPGKGGQKLIKDTLGKVKNLSESDIDIQVDGGINDKTALSARESGANILVVGNYLISSENLKEAVEKIKK